MSSRGNSETNQEAEESLSPDSRYCVDLYGTIYPRRAGWDFEHASQEPAVCEGEDLQTVVFYLANAIDTPMGPIRHGLRQTKYGYLPAIFEVDKNAFMAVNWSEDGLEPNVVLAMEMIERMDTLFRWTGD